MRFLCLHLLLLLAWPVFAWSGVGASTEGLQRYAEMSDDQIRGLCGANMGAGVDQQNAESESGAKYMSACGRTYEKARTSANKYFEKLHRSAAKLEVASANATCGGYRDPASQKTCFANAIEAAKQAKAAQSELESQLKKSSQQVERYMARNQKALERYQQDQQKIQTALDHARAEAQKLNAQGNSYGATMLYTNTARSSQVSGVSAKDGAASDINTYNSKIPQLVREQKQAIKEAQSFSASANSHAKQHLEKANKFDAMEKQLTAQMNKLAPSESGISGDSKAAEAKSGAGSKKVTASGGGADQSVAGGENGGSGIAEGDSNSDGSGASGGQGSSSGSSSGSSPSSSMLGSAAPAAAGMLGGASQGSGSGSSNYSPDPFNGFANTQGSSSGDSQTQADQGSARIAGTKLGIAPQASGQSEASEETSQNAQAKEGAEQSAAAASSGGLEAVEGETSGASSAPGIRGADGKPIRTGFSSSSGGKIASGSKDLDREVASKEQFATDLKSGAVSIAGSDVKSAIASLAEEFGAPDLDLDLDLGGLMADEKDSLDDNDDFGTGKGFPPQGGGNRRAASMGFSDEAAVLDEQSMALFARARLAHERALKRGNLILGIKKKL